MIAALLPAKALDRAKGRLAALLTEDERRQLALAMLEDVVKALQAVPEIDSVAVISPDAEVLDAARTLAAEAIEEPPSVRGLNQALAHGLSVMSSRPDALLVVLADVPAVKPADVKEVLDALPPDRGVVIAPSSAKGTSALALRPPDVIPFRFGEQSFQNHKREAAARKIQHTIVRNEALANDIDEPADLKRLLEHPAETATHRLLARLGVAGRLG
jgi:2-phospho-L-lactate guanylyltransferase